MLGLSNRAARVPTAGGAAAAAAVGPPRPPPRTCAPAAAGWGAGTPACASQWQMLESRRPCSHVCQAHPRRVAKVTSQIQREISEMFIYDDVMQRAICPDRGSGNAVSAIAGITHVYVSNDLQFVKVYVSVYSDERGRSTAMSNLKRLEPYVRSQIGARVALRLTPEIRFEYDDSIEEEELVASVLGADEIERLSRPEAGEAGAAGAAAAAGAARPQAADDDDDDGGFFEGLEGEGEEEEEYEEDFGEEEEYRGRTYDQPGPFDDLFGEAPAMGARGGGGGGGGGGGRQQQRQGGGGRRGGDQRRR